MVKRNVVLLCGTPTGQPGRPSKSLTLDQAHALVEQASGSTIDTYVLLRCSSAPAPRNYAPSPRATSTRTAPDDPRPAPHAGMAVGPGRRRDQDPHLAANPRPASACVDASASTTTARPTRAAQGPDGPLTISSSHPHRPPPRLRQRPARPPQRPPPVWTRLDTPPAAAQLRLPAVRRRRPVEQIARLIGHAGGSKVTDAVYRKQLRPVIDEGATAMNRVFVVPGRS